MDNENNKMLTIAQLIRQSKQQTTVCKFSFGNPDPMFTKSVVDLSLYHLQPTEGQLCALNRR